ncbi:MAG: terminase family protein [Firmicutes bacterium]|nr:terminase family protein [Bacillota bacterium]
MPKNKVMTDKEIKPPRPFGAPLRGRGIFCEGKCMPKNKVMTDKEIIAKLRLIEKKQAERKAKNRLLHYNTGEIVHLKQMEFHKCLKRNRWVFGGNRSGKTECGAAESVWLARGIHPYRDNKKPMTGWVVSPTLAVSREVAQSKILHYLNPDWIHSIVMNSGKSSFPAGGVIDYILVKHASGGVSKIVFKSAEMGREKFQGASLDFVWFDEEPPEEVYDECRMRVLDTKGEIFGTMTPLKGLTFVYNRIFLNEEANDETWTIAMEWADNPYLDSAEVERISAALSREQLEQRRYGRFVGGRGLVYPEFDPAVHVIPPFAVPRAWFDTMSIDPGLNNPLSCHWYAVDGDDNIYVIEEHYRAGQSVAYHAGVIKDKSRALGWHTDNFGRLNALIDSAASQRTLASERSVVELFLDHGIQVNTNVDKDLFSGINRVKQYLGGVRERLYIFDTCVNLIREFKTYWWGEGDVPKKRDDHALDELRYYIMSRPEPFKPPAVLSEIQRDKQRLARKLKGLRG